jgi:adenylate cyclase
MAAEPVERKLAAILIADMVGYSHMTGKDEEGTIRRLNQFRNKIIDPRIQKYRGRIVKTMGDGILVEFTSIVDAVACSLDIQHGSAARNENLRSSNRMMLPIGLHLGDVLVQQDGDLLGDGVNIAARLEAIAEPGTICLSEDAYRQVRDRVAENFVDLGEQQLKNIARPIRVYSIALHHGTRVRQEKDTPVENSPRAPSHEKPEIMSLPREVLVRGPGFRSRLRSV